MKEVLYFTVNKNVKINGKGYIPCVCYGITASVRDAVMELAKKGVAELHKDYLFYQNGAPLKKFTVDINIPKEDTKETSKKESKKKK